MRQIKHIGSYGLILQDNNILLIKKNGGPYDGKLDLPGGTIEFNETPEEALVRELKEEVGIIPTKYYLFDGNSVNIKWVHKGEEEEICHMGFFYMIEEFLGNIEKNIEITEINDDSKGAEFYNIKELAEEELSSIANIEVKKILSSLHINK